MTIGAAHAYTSPFNLREAYTSRTGAHAEQKITDAAASTRAAVASVPGQTTDNAITGTTGSRLSAEMTRYAIQATQEDANAEDTSPLPIGVQHGLDDIANNPEYAAKRAQELAESSDLVFFPAEEFPKNSDSADVWNAFHDKMKARMEVSNQAGQQRNAYYQSLKAEGMPPAQLYAKLMEFNANLPESYNDTVGFSNSGVNMTWSQYHTASHDYLQQAIAQANAAQASDVSQTDAPIPSDAKV